MFRDIGGRTIKEFISRVMCRVMTNELALLYNLNGRNGKEKFKETSCTLCYTVSFLVKYTIFIKNFA